jgi:hypothetical protein
MPGIDPAELLVPELAKKLRYFEHNSHRMHCARFKALGMSLGRVRPMRRSEGLTEQQALPASALGHAVVVAKYVGLVELLGRQQGERLDLTFEQLANVVPGGLPPSAYRHRAWWANEADGRHVHARAWTGAGWVVGGVDLAGRGVYLPRGVI